MDIISQSIHINHLKNRLVISVLREKPAGASCPWRQMTYWKR